MDHFMTTLTNIGLAALWTVAGLILFGLAFWVIKCICPFSIRKEIEEDQNTALGVVIGAVMLGIAIIVASAMH
ncbi:MAG TPA: DUF350 domain-containing protein [Planctomycetota bacterium]|jgi:uncharacterized membrane protein YjfL (UPF0719 family)